MLKYSFDVKHPPLLSVFGGNIIDIPETDLTQIVGKTALRDEYNEWLKDLPMLRHRHVHINTYTIVRVRRWVITQAPVHFAEDEKYDLKIVTGYSVEQKNSIENTMSLKFDEAGAFGGLKLSAEQKSDLKVTTETSVQWHTETTTDQQTTYKADTTYVTWSLLDTLQIDEVATVLDHIGDDSDPSPVISVDHHSGAIDNVLAVYMDKEHDAQRRIIGTFAKTLRLNPKLGSIIKSGRPRLKLRRS